MEFKVGDKIIGNFDEGGEWFKGTVKNIDAANGTYDVEYEDGDKEMGMAPKNVRAPESQATPAKAAAEAPAAPAANGKDTAIGGGDKKTPTKAPSKSTSDFSNDSLRKRQSVRDSERKAYEAQTKREDYKVSLFGNSYDTSKYHQVCLWDNSWFDWSVFILCFLGLYGITTGIFKIGFEAMIKCDKAHALGDTTSPPQTFGAVTNINMIPINKYYNVNYYSYLVMMFITFATIGTTVWKQSTEAARIAKVQEEKDAAAAEELLAVGKAGAKA